MRHLCPAGGAVGGRATRVPGVSGPVAVPGGGCGAGARIPLLRIQNKNSDHVVCSFLPELMYLHGSAYDISV